MQSRSKRADAARGIADAAARWRNADFPARVRAQARIVERTHYSLPVVEYALDRLFGAIAQDAILATIDGEIGKQRVAPIGRVAVISSRTTIGVALFAAIFAICAGCDVLVKDREDGLIAAFFETLAQELDAPFAAEQWNAAERDLSQFDCVVAFGGDDALAAIRAQLRAAARFIAYGPKASIGYVAREALRDEAAAREIATGAARDLVLYEGQGCLSLHALFVENGGHVPALEFMRQLANAVERANVEFPIGERDAAGAAKVASLRDLALFRGDPFFSDVQARFLVAPGAADRAPAFAPRVLDVHEIDAPAQMQRYVVRHALPIEAFAVAGVRDDVVNAAVACGANRIAPFGELQNPPLAYAHGGRPRFAEFVRFISQEEA